MPRSLGQDLFVKPLIIAYLAGKFSWGQKHFLNVMWELFQNFDLHLKSLIISDSMSKRKLISNIFCRAKFYFHKYLGAGWSTNRSKLRGYCFMRVNSSKIHIFIEIFILYSLPFYNVLLKPHPTSYVKIWSNIYNKLPGPL